MKHELNRFGIILFVERFDACRAFYQTIFELEAEFEKPGLIRFSFGSAYLMLESKLINPHYDNSKSQAVVRANTENLVSVCNRLERRGVAFTSHTFEWGSVIRFKDPDGTQCEFYQA